MYPATYFGLFPPFPANPDVFVAISFAPEFSDRLKNVVVPAIEDVGLRPLVVNAAKISESIITDICKGIGESTLVFADLSVMKGGYRNPNVMYEVGIAHATRHPQQVVLFRTDQEPLPFDVANIRVNCYDDLSDIARSRVQVKDALNEALRELDTTRSLAVKRVVDSLSQEAVQFLVMAGFNKTIPHPPLKTMGQALGNSSKVHSISRLLELGALKAIYPQITPEYLKANADNEMQHLYAITPLGKAVIQEISNLWGTAELIKDPDTAKRWGVENPGLMPGEPTTKPQSN